MDSNSCWADVTTGSMWFGVLYINTASVELWGLAGVLFIEPIYLAWVHENIPSGTTPLVFQQHRSASLKESNDQWVLLGGLLFLRAWWWEVELEAPRQPLFPLFEFSLSMTALPYMGWGDKQVGGLRPLGGIAKGEGWESPCPDAVIATTADYRLSRAE